MQPFSLHGHGFTVIEKQIAKTKDKAITITLTDTAKKLKDKKRSEITTFNYEDVKKQIEEKCKFDKKKKYQINVFTDQGWRSGDQFKGKDEIDWYDTKVQYGEENNEAIEDIYAIQIIEIN